MSDRPRHWERGYRCHGLWCDLTGQRLALVSRGPPPWDGLYNVHCDHWPHTRPSEPERTLRQAKRLAERYTVGR